MYFKKFKNWLFLKEKLHNRDHKPPHVSEGEIWWISIGENVGSEIDGKSNVFSRPIIIYKKLSHSFFFMIPTTTQEKIGTWFVSFTHRKTNMTACLHQARSIDYRRLSSKLGELDSEDFAHITNGFKNLYV